ncbi:TspO/MBR family protein [Flavihumibacter petaseus]|uniref:TSPO family protein n=1 Tax=Flavihumibacter petaseus NBRC 106054 TaxID=1220578 RepID=A0A0E9N665_9BACT|nr:TspO/MBR family protein [Flavihumibacter petaseus]GAO45319.1 TSPO family protein [Flavihumibacter petaseus NBRC 106054]
MSKWQKLVLALLLPLSVGGIGGLVTARNVEEWYPALNKPWFTPPNALFGPVWTILYLLMGISFYRILLKPPSDGRRMAVFIFCLQLFFNFWWSLIFFRFHLTGLALIDIILLWLLIMVMIRQFYRVDHWAANIQWPYLVWVTFAMVLNFWIWRLNL